MLRVAGDRLRLLLAIPISERQADSAGRRAEGLTRTVFLLGMRSSVLEAIADDPNYARQRWAGEARRIVLLASRNYLLPKLDTFGLYRIRGFGHDLEDGGSLASEDSAFADLTSGKHQEWEFGMEFNAPLGFRKGHAAVRNAQLALARERAVLDDQERQVVHDLSDAVADVDRAYQVAQIDYNRRMAARAQVAATKAGYESDRKVSLDLYLEAQRREADADSEFFASLVDYALAVKNVHYEKGSLLDYNEIYLAEGPWPDKAYKDAENIVPTRHQPRPMSYILQHTPPPVSQRRTQSSSTGSRRCRRFRSNGNRRGCACVARRRAHRAAGNRPAGPTAGKRSGGGWTVER